MSEQDGIAKDTEAVDRAFGADNRNRLIDLYFDNAGPDEISPATAWEHVYRLLLWLDPTTGLAHCYESDKSQPGKPWYARSLAFHDWLSASLKVDPSALAEAIDWLFIKACSDPKPPVHRIRAKRAMSPVVARIAAANRAATQEPLRQGFMNAVQVFPFSDGAIYRVYTAPGAVTDISLQPGESLVAVAAGDTVRWIIGDTTSGSGAGKRTHILVKPFASGLATNLVITTDRRSYHLQLDATSRTAMAALSWTYPADQLIALRRVADQAAAAEPVADGLSIDNLHFNYRVSGDRAAWRPLRAFDDGRQTFVEFPASIAVGEAPPLFIIGPTGEAELVNYRVRGRFYVVDRIFDAAELRLGTGKQQIVRIDRVAEGSASHKGKRS